MTRTPSHTQGFSVPGCREQQREGVLTCCLRADGVVQHSVLLAVGSLAEVREPGAGVWLKGRCLSLAMCNYIFQTAQREN